MVIAETIAVWVRVGSERHQYFCTKALHLFYIQTRDRFAGMVRMWTGFLFYFTSHFHFVVVGLAEKKTDHHVSCGFNNLIPLFIREREHSLAQLDGQTKKLTLEKRRVRGGPLTNIVSLWTASLESLSPVVEPVLRRSVLPEVQFKRTTYIFARGERWGRTGKPRIN